MPEWLSRLLAVIVGVLVMAGSAFVWHEWHVDGFVAFLMATFGTILVCYGVGAVNEG